MTFEIRAARADEIDRLYAVHRDSVIRLCAGHYSDAQIRGWLAGRTPAMYLPAIAAGRLWVADDGEPIGLVEVEGREATLNATAFYARHGFVEIGRGAFSHGAGGEPLEIVRMERALPV